ncbi:type III secretion system translocon subunit SctB [Acidovorax sp. CCYZU-2555]|uniref:type III secretion system translocon subunit SctB n=1 Tax=Acidovorax sp. CCYZU-2555 TaxID=2835042 RepID=UPI001BD113DF|nr:type III secretion system translocon subunit SctB [Acidovorax sp. CCYZU-2555]MBS7777594.1 type III secretion system translocon subunit SctB [Acidovorax sp. CCYZU-2555]
MPNIDSSIRTPGYQPGPGDADMLAPSGKKPVNGEVSMESAANDHRTAANTMASINALQMGGPQLPATVPTSPAAQAQLRTELSVLESNQAVDLYAVMGLIQKSAQEMRNTNREIRASELNAQVGELMSAASDMQKAANFRLAAGIVQGSVQMLSAGVQAYSSMSAASKSAQGAKPQGEATELKDSAQKMNDSAQTFNTEAQDLRTQAGVATDKTSVDNLQAQARAADDKASYLRTNARSMEKQAGTKQAQVDGFNASAQKASGNGDIAGKMLGGMGEIITAGLKFGADSADVSAKRHEARAKLHESASAGANEMMQQMMDVIRDVKDKLSSIDQSRIETNRGIARNI